LIINQGPVFGPEENFDVAAALDVNNPPTEKPKAWTEAINTKRINDTITQYSMVVAARRFLGPELTRGASSWAAAAF
jgi:hypothetical protein